MAIKASDIYARLTTPDEADPLVITPPPDLEELKRSGAASVDLRLGTWFLSCREDRIGVLDVLKSDSEAFDEQRMTRRRYVAFGDEFVLHPRAFVLGSTLEWIRLPSGIAGQIVGRSSWGRRGLIIATASGVHPGFSGCLTLEMTNLGEVPIVVRPGMAICQLFMDLAGESTAVDKSTFVGLRRPTLGVIRVDAIALKLQRAGLARE